MFMGVGSAEKEAEEIALRCPQHRCEALLVRIECDRIIYECNPSNGERHQFPVVREHVEIGRTS